MADQFDSNTRSSYPDAEIDDPLAELARIIGYERPPEVATRTEEAPESSEFDLEAELMRELDVPLAASVEEIDRIEADEALDELLADAGSDFEREPEQDFAPEQDFTDVLQPDFDIPELDRVGDDLPEFDTADFVSDDGRSSDALLRAIDNERPYEPEADDGFVADSGDEYLPNDLETDEVLPDLELGQPAYVSAEEQDHPGPVENDTPATVSHSGGEQAAAVLDPSDDEVLADIARFELPLDTQGRRALFPTQVSSPQVDDASGNRLPGVEAGYATETDALVSPEAPAMAEDAQYDGELDEAPLDFEEYLSTELDVFGQEVAMGEAQARIDRSETIDEADYDSDFSVRSALDTLNDSSLDDEVSVFDDAAEELLAAINDDGKISGGGASAGHAVTEFADEWSLESIEEAAADELDDELGDMFGLPERDVDPFGASSGAGDDLELDLEQVLADSFTASDEDWAEPVDLADVDVDPEEAVEIEDWQDAEPAAEPPVERDEMTEAFLGLVPAGQEHTPEPSAVSPSSLTAASFNGYDRRQDQSQAHSEDQDDWLDGFETSASEAGFAGSQPDADGYYFDAELITDAGETVEMVGDIDVPELVREEPQPYEPDYDTEIEREFAEIIERNEPNSDDGFNDAVATGFGAAEGWSRNATTSRGYEVSDEYIALERELGTGPDRSTGTDAAAHADGDGLAGEFDEPDEMARGYGNVDNGSRGPVVAIAVLALALLAGVGAFGWSMLSGDETSADGGPRIIRADTDPVKVLPENPGGVTVPNQDKAVYDRVAGGAGSSSGQPALVDSSEEPVDVVQRTLDPEVLPLEGRSDFNDKSEDRLSADGNDAETAASGTAPVVSARKVRTMIVRPDGSIVAREVVEPEVAVVAESQQNPAAVSSPVTTTQVESAATPQAPGQQAADVAVAAPNEDAAADTPLTEGALAPVRVVKTQPIRPVANAPVPQGRPADQPVDVIGTVSQQGTVAVAPSVPVAPAPAEAAQPVAVASAPAAAAAAPVANPGGYFVQIASQPTAEGAQASWRTLSSRYSSVLGGLGVDIQQADIPGKGVFHRVRVPAGTKDQANALCSRYKAAGGSCFVSR